MKTCLSMILAVLLISMLPAAEADACSCVPWPGVAEMVERSDFVFAGRVASIAPVGTGGFEVQVTFAETKCWKGAVGSNFSVTTASSGDMCGVEFALGQEYLVYANMYSAPIPSTNNCTRTRTVSSAQMDLEELGKPGCIVSAEDRAWGAIKARFDQR